MDLRVRTKCEVCGGSGVVYAPKCSACDAHYDPADLENSAFWGKPRMPCGHLRSCLIEEWECYECQGTGKKEWWIGFDQHDIQRQEDCPRCGSDLRGKRCSRCGFCDCCG
jgi:DnaJ-class molecular chaperone